MKKTDDNLERKAFLNVMCLIDNSWQKQSNMLETKTNEAEN